MDSANGAPDKQTALAMKEALLRQARGLPRPGLSAVAAFADKGQFVAGRVSRLLEERADLETLIGPGNLELMRRNHENHVRFMADSLADFAPEALVETVIWVLRTYMSRGFTLGYWRAELPAFIEVLTDEAPEAAGVLPIYEFMFARLDDFHALSAAPSLWETPPEAITLHGSPDASEARS